MTQFTIELNEEMVRKIKALSTTMRGDLTVNEVIKKMCVKGVEDYCYRAKRNAQKWQEYKELKAQVAAMKEGE